MADVIGKRFYTDDENGTPTVSKFIHSQPGVFISGTFPALVFVDESF